MASVAAVNSLGKYAFNPRGNLWYNDESTLGHRLLSKMGWSKGKGLGKNEDGIKENINIKVKGNNSGIGWKDKLYADVQSVEYDALLKSLNEGNSQNEKTSNPNNEKRGNRSLVELSRGFRNRLHYQKFIRVKDVSQYSEKDMKAIFLFNSKSDDKKSESDTEEKQVKTESENKEQNSVETYKSDLSISDYFAKKMKEKNDKLLNKVSSNKLDLQQTASELENREKRVPSSINDVNVLSAKKKRTNSEEIISMNNSNSITAEEKEQYFSQSIVPKKKRKRSVEESVMEDASLPLKDATCENEVSYKILNKKKKRRKIGEEKRKNLSPIKLGKVCNGNANSCETDELMKSSETKSISSFSSDSVTITEVQSTTIIDGVSKQLKKEKKKEKKKFKMKNLKSCLKCKKGKYCVKNVSFSERVSYRIINKDDSIFDFNSDSHLVSPDKEECNILDAKNDCDSGDEVAHEDETKADEPNATNEICSEVQMQVEESDGSALSDLPSTKSAHFNMWVESQKQALKMKMYKRMLKSIKKHDVLQTTNLLSIKGYGNWGF